MNKYRNKKWELGGITFDSHKEARRWQELRFLLREGVIQDLQLQVPFILIPAQKDKSGKVIERAVVYRADFVYQEKDPSGESHIVVEDVKSEATKTREYVIKRKLMLYKYGIQIKEV